MKKIVFATGNAGKMKEIREILADLPVEIYSMKEAGISVEIDENGKTFEENAKIKAQTVAGCTDGDMIVLDALTFETPKTREMAKVLTAIGATKKTLLVLPGKDETIYRVSNNIPGLEVAFVNTINVLDIMKCDKFVVLKDAVAQIEEVYARTLMTSFCVRFSPRPATTESPTRTTRSKSTSRPTRPRSSRRSRRSSTSRSSA